MPVNAVTQINEMIEENEEDTKKKLWCFSNYV